jgi:hypothetical protein
VHTLGQRLERLATQHAALVAVNAQQQEAWEVQAGSDLRVIKEGLGHLGAAMGPMQRQVGLLAAQVASLQGQLAAQRALGTMQQAIVALAALALGTGWGPAALWALAAASVGALAAAALAARAADGAGAAVAEAAAAAERAARLGMLQAARGCGSSGGGAGAAAAAGACAAPQVAAAGMVTLHAGPAAGGKAAAGELEPPPTAPEVEQLQCRHAYGAKTIDETVRWVETGGIRCLANTAAKLWPRHGPGDDAEMRPPRSFPPPFTPPPRPAPPGACDGGV